MIQQEKENAGRCSETSLPYVSSQWALTHEDCTEYTSSHQDLASEELHRNSQEGPCNDQASLANKSARPVANLQQNYTLVVTREVLGLKQHVINPTVLFFAKSKKTVRGPSPAVNQLYTSFRREQPSSPFQISIISNVILQFVFLFSRTSLSNRKVMWAVCVILNLLVTVLKTVIRNR